MTGRMLRRWVAAGMVAVGLLLAAPPPFATPAALTGQGAPPQRPPRRTDPVEELERKRRQQEEEAKREQERRERAARADRREALRQVHEDLGKMRETLKALETTLAETDPDQELSLELRRRSEELEKLAKGVRKNIKRL